MFKARKVSLPVHPVAETFSCTAYNPGLLPDRPLLGFLPIPANRFGERLHLLDKTISFQLHTSGTMAKRLSLRLLPIRMRDQALGPFARQGLEMDAGDTSKHRTAFVFHGLRQLTISYYHERQVLKAVVESSL